MAKVMISFPDELLERLDAHTRQLGTTRSGLLQTLAERELASSVAARKEQILALIADPRPQGGDSVELVRAARRSR